jgi:spermidine synthase
VLVLGGGDGLAVREILRHPEVESVTLVDLDPSMTRLGREHPLLRAQNGGSLGDSRVQVINEDAFAWLGRPERVGQSWEVILIDFPDPNNFSLGKLYTTRFYKMVGQVLAPGGALAVQATSPLLARRSFWCVVGTMEAAGLVARAYHATVPAFGEWGYVLAAATPFEVPSRAPDVATKYLDGPVTASLFVLSPDMSRVPADVNRLNNQILVQYYEAEWGRWN